HFFKRIVIDGGAGAPLAYVERVARFTLEDFERMFARHDLVIEALHGDYRLNAYDTRTSPRMILVAKKSGTGHARGRDGCAGASVLRLDSGRRHARDESGTRGAASSPAAAEIFQRAHPV